MTTSSDGYLVATAQTTPPAVLLAVNFTGASGIGAGFSVTVQCTTPAGLTYTVRGLDSVRAPGGVIAGYDNEAPLGQVGTYTAAVFNAVGGVIHSSTSAAATPPLPVTAAKVWLKSLPTPTLSYLFSVTGWPQWTAPITQGTFTVIGRQDQIVKSDIRNFENGTLGLILRTGADVAATLALLNSPGPYMMQAQGFNHPDRFVVIGATTRSRLTMLATSPMQTMQLPVQCVGRPATKGSLVAIPGHTYNDSGGRWGTYTSRTGSYLTRATT